NVDPGLQRLRHRAAIEGIVGRGGLTQIGPDADGGKPEALELPEMAGKLRLKTAAIALRPHRSGISWYQHVLESPPKPSIDFSTKIERRNSKLGAISELPLSVFGLVSPSQL